MNDRKILLFTFFLIIYCFYSVQMWFMTYKTNKEGKTSDETVIKYQSEGNANNTDEKVTPEKKTIPLILKNACSAIEIFTEKPNIKRNDTIEDKIESENNTITVIGITAFLIILVLNALVDVLKVKEEERARRKLNPDGERRHSLAEFANKKVLRRESSKFGLQLFQIAETVSTNSIEDKMNRRESRPYTRGDSTNSYLSDKKPQAEGSAPASICDTSPAEPRLVKRQSVAKLIGARPVPMVRRSSFPALPLNPEIQALMLGSRQSSLDSDDEGDGKGRRVRIIRRY